MAPPLVLMNTSTKMVRGDQFPICLSRSKINDGRMRVLSKFAPEIVIQSPSEDMPKGDMSFSSSRSSSHVSIRSCFLGKLSVLLPRYSMPARVLSVGRFVTEVKPFVPGSNIAMYVNCRGSVPSTPNGMSTPKLSTRRIGSSDSSVRISSSASRM